METKIIKNLIVSYFNVVRKNINDTVPKTIMAFLVNQSKIAAQRELVKELYKEGEFEELLAEDAVLVNKREGCKEAIKNLRAALETINDVRDFHFD